MPPPVAPFIVDSDGQPRLFWRGETSGKLVQVFDRTKTLQGSGFFFAEDRHQAKLYVSRSGPPEQAYRLRASRLLDLCNASFSDSRVRQFVESYAGLFDEWVCRYSGERMDPYEAIELGSLYSYDDDPRAHRWHALFRQAESMGYDAVRTMDCTDGVVAPVCVVFRPDQISHVSPALLEAEVDATRSSSLCNEGGLPLHRSRQRRP